MGSKRFRNKNKKAQTRQNQDAPLVVVTTGGSGGHIFPAEAICSALIQKGYRVAFITDKRGKAFKTLPGVQTYKLMSEAVARRTAFHKMVAVAKLFFGSAQALRLLQKLKPAAVIGVGGYASFPAVLAAHLWSIPVVLHEQNAVLGRANRILAKGSKLIATSFSPTKRVPANLKQLRVGMPARDKILKKENAPYPLNNDTFNLLVFGGSQGASFFSRIFPEVLLQLPEELKKKLVLTQQARPEDIEYVRSIYKGQPFVKVTVESFFDNMPELLANSNLVVSRGGASTITELEVIGRPAMIVPLPTAADDHQTENAAQFCDSGAGWLIPEKGFNSLRVAERLAELMNNPQELTVAAEQAYNRAMPKAAEMVVDEVSKIIQEK